MTLRIAVVEDDESIRTMLEYYFKSMGHEVLAFESGEDFFDAAPVADLALLDVMLPGMDGLDIVRRLRGEEATAKLPIIMLTARQTEMDKVTALDLGADDYISKPFGVMELQARVNAVMRRVGDRDPMLRYRDLVIDHRHPGRGGHRPDLQGVRTAVPAGAPPGHCPHPGRDSGRRVELRLHRRDPHRGHAHQSPAPEAGGGLYHHGALRGL